RPPPPPSLFPSTTLFRSLQHSASPPMKAGGSASIWWGSLRMRCSHTIRIFGWKQARHRAPHPSIDIWDGEMKRMSGGVISAWRKESEEQTSELQSRENLV